MFKWIREFFSLLRELKTNMVVFNKNSAEASENARLAAEDLQKKLRELEHEKNIKENRRLRDGDRNLMKKWMRRWVAMPIPSPTVRFDTPHGINDSPRFKGVEAARNFRNGISYPSGAPDYTNKEVLDSALKTMFARDYTVPDSGVEVKELNDNR
jgi:hypothetical protein